MTRTMMGERPKAHQSSLQMFSRVATAVAERERLEQRLREVKKVGKKAKEILKARDFSVERARNFLKAAPRT